MGENTVILSNNRTEGHGRREKAVPVERVVSDFLESGHSDDPRPFTRRLQAFILEYDVDGLKRYAPMGEDLVEAIRAEYDRQRHAEE